MKHAESSNLLNFRSLWSFLIIVFLSVLSAFTVFKINNYNRAKVIDSPVRSNAESNSNVDVTRNSSEKLLNKASVSQSPDNLLSMDWSKSLNSTFSKNSSKLIPEGSNHSKLVRVLFDKPAYEIGDTLKVIVRIDQPAGVGPGVQFMSELISPKLVASARPAEVEGPFTFAQAPQSLFYKVKVFCNQHRLLTPGLWTFQFGRKYLNVERDKKTENDRFQFELFEVPVRFVARSRKGQG